MPHPMRFLHLGGHDLLTDVLGHASVPYERPFPSFVVVAPGRS
jgi:hypothetical protein